MQIYVHRNNQQLGPFTEDEIKAQLASGTISLLDHVWWQGQAGWIPLSQSPFSGVIPPVTPPTVTGLPGLPPATPGPHWTGEKTSNLALWSMICGIISPFCGLTFIPAIILGHMGLSETTKNPAIKGRGMAWAGLIIGYAVLALCIISLIAMCVLMALGNQVKNTFKTINAQVQSAQAQPSSDSSDSDQSTNSPDQSTNGPTATPASPDNSTNSAPVVTP